MSSSAPRRESFSSFASDEDVAITHAPAAFANWSANSDTAPLPITKTVSPGFTLPSVTSPRHAVTPAQGSVAACAKLQPAGARVKAQAGIQAYSRAYPSIVSPGMSRRIAAVVSPDNQYGQRVLTTASPASNSVTPSPQATTTPAASDSGTHPSATGITPFRTKASCGLRELALTRTSTSPAFGVGGSSSSTRKLVVPDGAFSLTIFMDFLAADR